VFGSIGPAFAQRRGSGSGIDEMAVDELAVLERDGWDALSTSGGAARAFYERVLDESVAMLLPGGAVLDERAEILDAMSGPPWTRFSLEDMRTLRPTHDTGVVTYGVEAERDGQRYSALMSSLYVRRDDGWKLAFHQQTPR
jgi:hypothetical protein